VLLAVLARPVDATVVSAAIQSARQMTAEPERRDVLLQAVDRAASAEVLLQVVAASQELTSSPVRRDMLLKVLSRPALPGSVLRAVFNAAAAITASPEKRDVLVHAAGHQRLDAASREAYVAAANTITASPERAQALSALLGGGREGTAAAPATPQRTVTTSTSHVHEDDDGSWSSDIVLTLAEGRTVHIRARGVERGSEPDDIRRIRRGGSLVVEETRRGVTRRAELAPARGGGITRSYRVDGVARTFDGDAERWLAGILREFTRKS
jgi:hypothetical protein